MRCRLYQLSCFFPPRCVKRHPRPVLRLGGPGGCAKLLDLIDFFVGQNQKYSRIVPYGSATRTGLTSSVPPSCSIRHIKLGGNHKSCSSRRPNLRQGGGERPLESSDSVSAWVSVMISGEQKAIASPMLREITPFCCRNPLTSPPSAPALPHGALLASSATSSTAAIRPAPHLSDERMGY